jgi:amino acid adenylation domain-containing protein
MPGLELGFVDSTPGLTAKFDLSLDLAEAEGRIVGGVTYATALFEGATVERYLGYLRRVLHAMGADEYAAVAHLPLLPEGERRQVVEGWNATDAAYPDACIHELVQAQVERSPDAVAVVHGHRSLTYAELNARANRLAHHLRQHGVGPDTRVGICSERRLDMVVALLAVLKAGGAYVPLDPAYPAERLRFMLQDSAPVAVLGDAAARELFPGLDVPVIDLSASGLWAGRPATDPDPGSVGVRPHHLAYVIYTSGSTGRPKGVMIEHRSSSNFLRWARDTFDGGVLQRTLFSTSLNFDLSVFECFAPLVSGASVEVVRDALQPPGAGVTLVNTVPSAMKALLQADRVPPGVHTVNLAGEPLRQALVEQIFAATGVERVCNLFGPTETTTYSTWMEMKRDDGFARHIGRPVANTKVYILDGHGAPVPVRVVGEMYIGGAGVARGYLDRPALTAERFVADPFSPWPGARMYRTGDLARWRPDGMIEFLGRNDHQVKVRGFRIELPEIETLLLAHPQVREAVVLAREDAPGDPRLVAYYVGAEAVGAEALRAYLSERMPAFMVPAAYVRLQALPLTPNGKLDRRALPAPEGAAYGTRVYEAPAGEAEELLAGIWSELLGVEQVGRHDNFFRLGGHSLLVVGLIERMRQAGLHADVQVLFTTPTLAALAAAMRSGTREVEVPANLIPDSEPDDAEEDASGPEVFL